MNSEELRTLTCIRVIVGYLGEKDQYGWWNSAFFSRNAAAFISPLFPRTHLLSQTAGATIAATLLHDDRIGVGNVFHLFRLPEDIEQSIHRILQESIATGHVMQLVADSESAFQELKRIGTNQRQSNPGPSHMGDLHALRDSSAWKDVAAAYAHAFASGHQTFPYFSDHE